jgi:hypothetical protein
MPSSSHYLHCPESVLAHEQSSQTKVGVIAVPKAYPDEEEEAAWLAQQREQEFVDGMRAREEKFFGAVSAPKPYLDYIAFLTGAAIVSAVFFTAVHAFLSGGAWSTERTLVILVVSGFVWFKFIPPMVRTSGALAEMSLIWLAKLFRLPYPFSPVRSITLRWLYECYTLIALWAMIIASSWICYEIGQRTGAMLGFEMHYEAKAPDTKKAEPKVEKLPPMP